MKLTRRQLWAAHALYAAGQDDQAKLDRAVTELGIKAPRARAPSTKPKGPSEQDILNAILKMLRLHPKVAMVWRQNVGMAEFDGRPVRFGFVGQPDLCGIMRGGRALFMEVKRPGGKPTAAQDHFLRAARDAGALVAVVHSVDEAAAALAEAWKG